MLCLSGASLNLLSKLLSTLDECYRLVKHWKEKSCSLHPKATDTFLPPYLDESEETPKSWYEQSMATVRRLALYQPNLLEIVVVVIVCVCLFSFNTK